MTARRKESTISLTDAATAAPIAFSAMNLVCWDMPKGIRQLPNVTEEKAKARKRD